MLQAMRTGTRSVVVKAFIFGLLLVAMFGLVFMDVQGMFRSGVSNTTLVKIGREKISSAEFSQMVQSAIRNQRMTEAQAYAAGMHRELLDQEIKRRLFERAADDLGLIVGDKDAAPEVKAILAPLVSQGMTEQEALQRLLMAFNMSEGKFVSSVKQQIAVDKLTQALSSGARAPAQLINDALKYRYELRQGAYFTLSDADAAVKAAPSEDELKEHYKKISRIFTLPEYRSFSVLVLDKKSLGLEGAIADDILKQYYEDNTAEFTDPETRKISQLVVTDEALAKEIFEKVKISKSLKKAGEEAGKGKANFVTDTYSEQDMPVEFAAASFKALKGDVLEPVKTALGWHILHIEDILPAATKPFEAVKDEIAKTISEDKAADVLYEHANKVDDLVAGGAKLAEVAAELKLQPVTFTKLDALGLDASGKKTTTSFGAFDKLLKEVFTLGKDEASQLVETPEGSFLIAEISDIVPAAEEPFEKVRAQVALNLTQERTSRLLDEKAAKIIERLQLGESFEKVAAEFGKKVERTDFLQRDAEKIGNLPYGFLSALFALDKIGQATTVGGEGSLYIIRLAARKADAPKDKKKEDVDSLTSFLNRSLQNDILDQYRNALMAEYDVTVNTELLDQMFKPKGEEADGE